MIPLVCGVIIGAITVLFYWSATERRAERALDYAIRLRDREADPAERWTIRGVDHKTRAAAMALAEQMDVNVGAVVATAIAQIAEPA